jgi:hypothetical protein
MRRVLIPAPRGALDRTAGQSILIESSPYIRACPIGDARLCLRRASSGQAREPLARSLIPAEARGAKADCLEPSRRLRLRRPPQARFLPSSRAGTRTARNWADSAHSPLAVRCRFSRLSVEESWKPRNPSVERVSAAVQAPSVPSPAPQAAR